MQTTHTPTNQSRARLVLTVTETAEALGISRTLAYELIRRGELPAIRLGRRIVIPAVQLNRLVQPDAGEDTPDTPNTPDTEPATGQTGYRRPVSNPRAAQC